MNYIDHIKGYLSRAALLLLMAGGALMAGCEDFLVRDVPNQTTDEEWWQNKGAAQHGAQQPLQAHAVGQHHLCQP